MTLKRNGDVCEFANQVGKWCAKSSEFSQLFWKPLTILLINSLAFKPWTRSRACLHYYPWPWLRCCAASSIHALIFLKYSQVLKKQVPFWKEKETTFKQIQNTLRNKTCQAPNQHKSPSKKEDYITGSPYLSYFGIFAKITQVEPKLGTNDGFELTW